MKRILFLFAFLFSIYSQAQVRVCQLPQVTNGTVNDYIIKEDSTCNGTRKIKISDFLSTYGIGTSTVDTTSISNRINLKVDSIYKNSTKDSIVYTINGRRHAIKDSIGSSSSTPITVDFLTLTQLTVDHEVIEGQVYKYVDETFLPASIDHILLTGTGTQTYNNIGQAYVTAIGKYVQCDYDLASNDISGSYVVWAGDISQAANSDPSIVRTHVNLMGETPTFSYIGTGEYWFNTVTYSFLQSTLNPFSMIKVMSGQTIAFYSLQYFGTNTLQINSGVTATGLSDDIMDTDYIEIKISF